MDGLVAGSALSYLIRGKILSKRSIGPMLSYVLAPLAIICLLALMHFSTWRDPWMGRWGFALAAVASAIIITDVIAGENCFYRRVLSTKPLVYLGRISYGIYLLHFPLYTLFTEPFPGAWGYLVIPAKIALTIVVAAACFYFIESPFLKLKKRFA